MRTALHGLGTDKATAQPAIERLLSLHDSRAGRSGAVNQLAASAAWTPGPVLENERQGHAADLA